MVEIKRGFGPPAEVTRYLDDKGWRPSFSWQDISGDEHASSHAVAKVTELELGSAFKRSLLRAQARGEGFETWRTLVVDDLRKIGWGLPRHVADPTGKTAGAEVDFTSRNRLRTIYWGNMASARSAGQWERAQRTKRALPYILYVRTTSKEPRKEHLGWVGIILPVDHPIWRKIWPPNGWHCHCSIRQITERERDRLLAMEPVEGGIRYTTEPPELEMRTWTNGRTGEVLQIPKGCDPGWGGHPGLARVNGVMRSLEEALVEAEPADATRTLERLWESPWTRVVKRLPDAEAKEVWLPAGVSPRLQAETGARSPVVSINGLDVKKRSNLDGAYSDRRSYDDLAKLPSIIAGGRIGPDPRGSKAVRSIIWQDVKAWWRGFVARSKTGYLRVTSLHQQDGHRALREMESWGDE